MASTQDSSRRNKSRRSRAKRINSDSDSNPDPGSGGELTREQAYAVLEPYFLAARETFLVYTESLELGRTIKRTRLECMPEMHDTERHFAGASTDGRVVAAAPQMVDLPEDTVAAIFAHEFGHIVDFTYAAQFVVVDGVLVFRPDIYEPNDKASAQMRIARMRQWEARSEDEIELTADLIAEQAVGHRIGYSGPCLLQGFNRGVERPKGLR